jgi:hypothetical protein
MRVKPHIFDRILANCEARGECMHWNGRYDDFGNPVMDTKRFKEKYQLRQDVLVYEEAHGTTVVDEEYLVHLCGDRGCLNAEHMRYLTDAADRAGHDREVRADAKRMLKEGAPLKDVKFATGLSAVRLDLIRREVERESKGLRVVNAEAPATESLDDKIKRKAGVRS